MIRDGDYATPAIICSARNGVCFKDGTCSTCDIAEKYKLNKLFLYMVEICEYKSSSSVCAILNAPCKGTDCERMLMMALQDMKAGEE